MHPKNWEIGQIGDPQGVSTLVFLLDDENQHVRRAAARRRDLSYRLELGHDIRRPHLPIRLHQTVGYSPRQLISWRARFHLPHSDPVGFDPNPRPRKRLRMCSWIRCSWPGYSRSMVTYRKLWMWSLSSTGVSRYYHEMAQLRCKFDRTTSSDIP